MLRRIIDAIRTGGLSERRQRCRATWVTLGSGTGMEQDAYVCPLPECDVERGVCVVDPGHFAASTENQDRKERGA